MSWTDSSVTGQTLSVLLETAREYLQDEMAGAYRYSDEDLVEAYNNFVLLCRRVRPDFFVNVFDQPLPRYTVGDLAEQFIFPPQYFDAAAIFMAGNANLRDDQFTDDGRAQGFIARATAELTKAGI